VHRPAGVKRATGPVILAVCCRKVEQAATGQGKQQGNPQTFPYLPPVIVCRCQGHGSGVEEGRIKVRVKVAKEDIPAQQQVGSACHALWSGVQTGELGFDLGVHLLGHPDRPHPCLDACALLADGWICRQQGALRWSLRQQVLEG
jgi:hypothetical protein